MLSIADRKNLFYFLFGLSVIVDRQRRFLDLA